MLHFRCNGYHNKHYSLSVDVVGYPGRLPVPGPPGPHQLGEDEGEAETGLPGQQGGQGAQPEVPQHHQLDKQRQPEVDGHVTKVILWAELVNLESLINVIGSDD